MAASYMKARLSHENGTLASTMMLDVLAPSGIMSSVDDLDFGIGARGKLQAFLLVALAVFMLALAAGIWGAPMNMKPVLAFLLKAFILLVFGGIAVACLLNAYRLLRPSSDLPPQALAHCLTCGEASAHEVACPVCEEPPRDRALAFQVQSKSILGEAFVAVILTGVGALGLFLMIGPWLDGERRWWALIAFAALGLLMLALGFAGVFGFAMVLRSHLQGKLEMTFSYHGPERFTQGKGVSAWGKLLCLEGHGQVTVPLGAQVRSEGGYRAHAGDVAVAEMVATFHAAGLVDLGKVTQYDWRLGDASKKARRGVLEFERTTKESIVLLLRPSVQRQLPYSEEDGDLLVPPPEPPMEDETLETDVIRYLGKYLGPSLELHVYKQALDGDPLHRAQAQMHARVLRDRGIVPADEVVEALVGLLGREQPRGT